ncbi:MAG TPA: aminotransferase class V-fold PLP-dependent enzyme [Casimicrobiaceae bacterium]
MRAPIYLDHAATTPVDPRVVAAMLPWLGEGFGNASSRSHPFGRRASAAIEGARGEVAALVGCDASEIVFTSGATESINIALKGAASFHRDRGRHLVTLATEHRATLDTLDALAGNGFEVTRVPVGAGGLVDPARFAAALRPDTTVASVMAVNNETGVVQDIAALGAICRAHGVVFHVDAAQATGKLALDLASLPVDLMSLSAHKTCGPKGVGALFVRRRPRARIDAQTHGGGQERGLRAGTLATHQIVGMGEAFRLAGLDMDAENARIGALRDRLWRELSAIGSVHRNGDPDRCVPQLLNVAFAGIAAEELMLEMEEIAVSTGSACGSGSTEPSHVLRALGVSDELAHGTLRFSLGRSTTAEEIAYTAERVKRNVAALRGAAGRARPRRRGLGGGVTMEAQSSPD